MKRFQKSFILILTAIMLITMAAPALANGKQGEHPKKHWAEEQIEKWQENGVVQGYPDGTFKPDNKVTRAELVSIINKLFGFSAPSEISFSDVPANAWYASALSIAKQAGYYKGFPENKAKADTEVTRQDTATLLASVFSLSPSTTTTKVFTDQASISPYAKEGILSLSGILSGYPDGTFRPNHPITRAEVVTIVDKLISNYYYAAGTYTEGDIQGNVLINSSGAVLKNAIAAGNLYLTSGIGNGEGTLENVTVKGKVLISGGGEHSIHLKKSKLAAVKVHRPDGKVRVVVEDGTVISQLMIDTASIIEVSAGTTIDQLVIENSATGTLIISKGNISKLVVDASSVSFNGVALAAGTYAVKDGVLVGQGTSTPVTGGNGGGTGGAGGTDVQPSATPEPTPQPSATTTPTTEPGINIVDEGASTSTKSLLAYLDNMSGKQVMFGHQHDTTVSFAGKDHNGNVISDVYSSTGDYPAVFGWDTLALDGYENPPGVSGDYEASRLGLTAAMKQAHELGGIVTLSTHPYNPVTGGDFKDTSNTSGASQSVVSRILPGGDKNGELNKYLDRIADFANQLKDDEGNLIPVLFRPFHEQNGGWFWWGAATTTKSEYAELYRYTVEYLRDIKDVHNFLYVYSPNGSFNGNPNEYLTTYPGDQYVDILGMDQYDDKENAGSQNFLNGLVKDLKMISQLAQEKGKIVTLSEYGYSASGMKTTGNGELEWFTKVLNAIKADPDASKISYMLTWANFGEGNNLYVPYKNAPGKEDHELLPDFENFYKDTFTAFASDVKDDNKFDLDVEVAKKKPFLHIVSPTNVGTVTDGVTVIRAKVLNAVPSKVVYTVGNAEAEVEMLLGVDGYYSAPWQPDANLNGSSTDITVKAYGAGDATLTQTNSVFLKIKEAPIKVITFDTDKDLELIQNNGTWSGHDNSGDVIKTTLQHASLDADGKLVIQVNEGLSAVDDWQELKLQLNDVALAGVDLSKVARVKFSVLIPVSAQNDANNAAVRSVIQLPQDWNTKYGMDSSFKSLSDLEQVNVDGSQYYKYDVSIDLDDAAKSAEATGLAISIVGYLLDAENELPIYIDNIGLYNTYTAPVADKALVDNFEAYGSSDEALAAKYPKAGGDDVSVALSSEHKASGNYGMKLHYSINNAGYTGVGKSLGVLDWSDYNALSMWVASDGGNSYAEKDQPLKLVVQLVIDGGYFEAYPVINPDKNGKIVLSLKDLAVMSWGKDGELTQERLKRVQSFNLYVNSMDKQSHEGSLYFDDIQAVYDPTLPEMSESGSGGSAGHEPGVLYNFNEEADIVGWTTANGSANAKTPVFNASEQAIAVQFDLINSGTNADGSSKESFELAINPEKLNITGLDVINAKVKLSNGTAKARLFIKTGAGWKWSDSPIVTIDSTDYTTLSISLPAIAAEAGVDLAAVKTIGIKVEDISNDGGTAELYLNEVSLEKAVPEVHYGFETGIDGWVTNNSTATVSTEVYAEGKQSLKLSIAWDGVEVNPYIAVSNEASLDLSGFSKLTAKVRIVSGHSDVQAKLFLKVGDNYTWVDSGAKPAVGDVFTDFTFNLSGNPNLSSDDLKKIKAIGIQIVTPSTAGTATAYIDEIIASK